MEVAETAAVQRALKEGRLKEETMPRVYNYQGRRYTAETLHEAPGEFLLELAGRGLLPEGIEVPAPAVLGTVQEVLAAVEDGELDPTAALAAERAGKQRVTLIAALETMLEEEE